MHDDEARAAAREARVLTVAIGIAQARGWSPEAIAQGELRGTLPYDEARAGLAALRVEDQQAMALSAEEYALLLAALAFWQTRHVAPQLESDTRTYVLEHALRESQRVDDLFVKLEDLAFKARELRLGELDRQAERATEAGTTA